MAVASFNIAPGESSDAAAQRRKLAMALMMQGADTSPVQHWTQGAAKMAQAIMGGLMMRDADEKDAQSEARKAEWVSGFLPGGGKPAAAPSAPNPVAAALDPAVPPSVPQPTRKATEPLWSSPGANGATVQDVNGQRVATYQDTPGEGPSTVPSPLDPPSLNPKDPNGMRLAAALVQAEAGNQGATGKQSVANVLRNRAAESGMNVPQVVNQPGQFEPVMNGRMGQYGPGTPGYDDAVAAVERAYTGNDPTAGAVNFYAPKAQAALAARDGRPPVAKFDNGAGIDIQDQRYFTRATGGTSPGITEATAQSRVPTAAPTAAPQQPGIAPDMMNRIRDGLASKDPVVRKAALAMGTQIAQANMANQLKPETTDEIKEYNLYSRQEESAGRKPKSFFDFKADLKRAGAVNVQTNVGGGSDKQIFDSVDASTNAARTAASGLVGIREARAALQGGMVTGAGANEVLGLQKIGAALGIANSDKIVNTETFRAAIAPQVAAVLKSTVGTANISNTDREFAEKAAGGNITLDGKSIGRLLDIMERAGSGIVTQHQKRLERVYPDAEKYARERALFSVDLPDAPTVTPQPTPSVTEGMTATNPQTKQKVIFKGGQWVPLQ